MRPRVCALVLTLLIACAPVSAVVCEIDCEPAAASTPCHLSHASDDGSALRAGPHGCSHDHADRSPAATPVNGAANGRHAAAASAIAPLAAPVRPTAHDAGMVTASAMHGPPGSNGFATSSRPIVLRI